MPAIRKILCLLTAYLTVFHALVLGAASPSLSVSQYPETVYLGDTVSFSVVLHDFTGSEIPPQFENAEAAASVEFLGSRDSTSRFESYVNGQRTTRVNADRIYSYRITPSREGRFTTGTVSIESGGRSLSAPGCSFNVIGPKASPDIYCTLEANYGQVLVDSDFKVVFKLSVKALPPPFEDVGPLHPDMPLSISAEYLNFGEKEGLVVPTPESALRPFISSSSRKASFTINQYTAQDFFERSMQRFHLNEERFESGGTNFWSYSLPIEYSATETGDYTFGPVFVKGEIPVLLDNRGNFRSLKIFVSAPALTVSVIPPPQEGRPAWYVGAVGSSMDIRTSLDSEHCKVGDPLSLTVDITGDFNQRSLSPPDIVSQLGDQKDFRIYGDNVETFPIPGGKRFKYRIRPLRAGTLEFPAVRAAFYNAAGQDYFTVVSEPLPLQAEATTQISAASPDAVDEIKKAEPTLPGGIIMDRLDRLPLAFTLFGANSLWILSCGPLALFLLVAAVKYGSAGIRTYLSHTRFSRGASGALRELRLSAVAAKRGEPESGERALRAARSAIALVLGRDAASVTESDIVAGLTAGGVPEEDAKRTAGLFVTLETSVYSPTSEVGGLSGTIDSLAEEIARAKSAMKKARRPRSGKAPLLILAAFLCLSLSPASAADVPEFEWERANHAMFTAAGESDFLDAARLYFAIVTNGASSGPLYYNLSSALILADKPQAALEALGEAEKYLGSSREVEDNWKAATARLYGGKGEFPVSRTFLFWHYGADLAARTDIAVFSWVLFCLLATVRILIPRKSGAAPAGAARRLLGILLCASALTFLFYGTTALIYHMRASSRLHNLPGVELSISTGPAEVMQ